MKKTSLASLTGLAGLVGLLALMMVGCRNGQCQNSQCNDVPCAVAHDMPGALNVAQTITNQQIFDYVYNQVKDDKDLPMSELVIKIAEQFLGTAYVSFTLEHEPEHLLVSLDKTDCILFVEQCTAFALTVKGMSIQQAGDGEHYALREEPNCIPAEPSYDLLLHNVQNLRYRLGVVDGYASRLHYTSEWILQNQTNGLMREITPQIGVEHEQPFYFMTEHMDQYRQMLGDSIGQQRIREAEKLGFERILIPNVSLKSLDTHSMSGNETGKHGSFNKGDLIITNKLTDKEIANLKVGDIITFVDSHPGLDLAHVALAYEMDGEMHFIHASYGGKCVMKEPRTLAEYAKNGIRVMRYTL